MNKQEFNAVVKQITYRKKISAKRAAALPQETKRATTMFLIRARAPIVVELLPADIDDSWLSCCGYMYETVSQKTGLRFRHTSEQTIK